MPELPEVECFARHLAPQLTGLRIHGVAVHCLRTVRPHSPDTLRQRLIGRVVSGVRRRAKYLVFDLLPVHQAGVGCVLGHLGMTGRIFAQSPGTSLPRHAVADLDLGRVRLVFEDARRFGRLHTDLSALEGLGPEPLSEGFTTAALSAALSGSRRAIKVCLMDAGVVAGIGNIYASESLFRARIHPQRAGGDLTAGECRRLWTAIRQVLSEAVERNDPQSLETPAGRESLFHHGNPPAGIPSSPFQVYDRAGAPCSRCRTPIRREVQASRSTYFCPRCQT